MAQQLHGQAELNAGQGPEAETQFRQSLASMPPNDANDPNNEMRANVHMGLAESLRLQGRNQEAIQEYYQTLQLAPAGDPSRPVAEQRIQQLGTSSGH